MAQVTVPVLKPLTHQGHAYVRGDRITLDAIQAAALARRGCVTLTRGATVSLTAPDPPRPARRRRPTYRRRDLRAEE